MHTNVLVLLAGIIGVLPNYVHLKETQEYAQYAIRGERILKTLARLKHPKVWTEIHFGIQHGGR